MVRRRASGVSVTWHSVSSDTPTGRGRMRTTRGGPLDSGTTPSGDVRDSFSSVSDPGGTVGRDDGTWGLSGSYDSRDSSRNHRWTHE